MVLLDCWLHTQTDSIYFLIVTIVLFIQRNITIMFWIFKLLIISINIIQKKKRKFGKCDHKYVCSKFSEEFKL